MDDTSLPASVRAALRDAPLDDETAAAVAEAVSNRGEGPVAGDPEADGDPGGPVARYDRLLPADRRRELGQFYTPPAVASAVVRWALPGREGGDGPPEGAADPESATPRVLDPACGTGVFVEAAARVLKRRYPDVPSAAVAGGLYAVDTEALPLALTAATTAAALPDIDPDDIPRHHGSFFDLSPATTGDRPFDAVVGNPPYIRQERVDKEHFRRHLAAFGDDGAGASDGEGGVYLDGERAISRLSDGYVYFLTHATQFLADGGRLGVVVPTKWLVTRYGESLQRFVLDHYRLSAVVGFAARAFEDALVDTALCLFERRSDPAARRAATVRFVRVRDRLSATELLDAVTADVGLPPGEPLAVVEGQGYRTVAVDQGYIDDRGPGKLGTYLTAPGSLVGVESADALAPLGSFVDVSRGVTTGANDFFYLSSADLERWSVADRFRRPAVKSFRAVDPVLTPGDATTAILDVHEFVASTRERVADDGDLAARVRARLDREGYGGLAAYVRHGEREGYHDRPTTRGRAVWFDLGRFDPPPLVHSKSFDEEVYTAWNEARAVPGDRLYALRPHADVDATLVAGLLNSTLHKCLLELHGRAEGGGALEVMAYELTSMPAVDPRSLAADDRDRIRTATAALRRGDDGAQRRLDRAVLGATDLDLSPEGLVRTHRALVDRRVGRGGDARVLVGGDRDGRD